MPDRDAQIMIDHNREEWDRLLLLLQNMETNSLYWINCDRADQHKVLRDALSESLPAFQAREIYLDSSTQSLREVLHNETADAHMAGTILHVMGIDAAVTKEAFVANLNFHRESVFNNLPAPTIIWGSFATSALLTHTAYDFWSWVFYTFNFYTPETLLTSRQQGFISRVALSDRELSIPAKDASERIRYLEQEWEEFLRATGGKPKTSRQMSDAVALARVLGKEYKDEGRYNDTIQILDRLIAIGSKFIAEQDYLDIWNELSISHKNVGDLKLARELGEQALDSALQLLGKDDPEIATFQSNLAVVYQDDGDLHKAQELLELALASRIRNFGDQHPTAAISRSNLAMVYQDLGDLQKARELLELALVNDIRNLGEQHSRVAVWRSNLGMVYHDLSDFQKALELLELALASDIRNFGERHSNVAMKRINLAWVYRDLGNLQKAKELMALALVSLIRDLGEQHRTVATCRSNLALVYQDLGDLQKAKELLELALDSDIHNFGHQHPNVALRCHNLAYIYLYLTEPDKAKAFMQRAYDIYKVVFGDEHNHTISSLQFLRDMDGVNTL